VRTSQAHDSWNRSVDRIRSRETAVFLIFCAVAICAACSRTTPLADGTKPNKVVILKSDHIMTLMNGSRVLRSYRIALGRSPVGRKTRRGDHRTPEGNYTVDAKESHSRFHLALHISYPNQADRERAQRAGVDTGGDVEIHGLQNGLGWIGSLHRAIDWTDGCIAVTDSEIDEIWGIIPVGTPVEIRP
jgi:murein L,D-transpeptidase YafK